MRQLVLLIMGLTMTLLANGQTNYQYEPSADNPYGRPNPEAPAQIKDWKEMIGSCDCKSELRNPDGSWNAPDTLTWTFKYIMNGHGVQDETLKSNGSHTGSIRQFIADSAKWYVHFYSHKGPTTTLPSWEGVRQDDQIVLFRDSKAPNGMDGDYRITFYDLSEKGYKWKGEWVSKDRTIVYPTWKIECVK